MRTQYCREHIDIVAKNCGIGDNYVQEVKAAADLVDENPGMQDCSTRAISPLLKIADKELRDLSISLVNKALNLKTPTGGKKYPFLDENKVKAYVRAAETELNTKRQNEINRIKKEAEKKHAVAKELERKEEDKRQLAKDLSVTLKITDPDYDTIKKPAVENLDKLKELLKYQDARREEQEARLKDLDEEIAKQSEKIVECKEILKREERREREMLGYRNSVIKEIAAINENCRQVVLKMDEQYALVV